MSLFVNEPIDGLPLCKCGGLPRIVRNRVRISVKFNSVAIECDRCGEITCEHLGLTDSDSISAAAQEWEKANVA